MGHGTWAFPCLFKIFNFVTKLKILELVVSLLSLTQGLITQVIRL